VLEQNQNSSFPNLINFSASNEDVYRLPSTFSISFCQAECCSNFGFSENFGRAGLAQGTFLALDEIKGG
jgi:hypothetical protein